MGSTSTPGSRSKSRGIRGVQPEPIFVFKGNSRVEGMSPHSYFRGFFLRESGASEIPEGQKAFGGVPTGSSVALSFCASSVCLRGACLGRLLRVRRSVLRKVVLRTRVQSSSNEMASFGSPVALPQVLEPWALESVHSSGRGSLSARLDPPIRPATLQFSGKQSKPRSRARERTGESKGSGRVQSGMQPFNRRASGTCRSGKRGHRGRELARRPSSFGSAGDLFLDLASIYLRSIWLFQPGSVQAMFFFCVSF